MKGGMTIVEGSFLKNYTPGSLENHPFFIGDTSTQNGWSESMHYAPPKFDSEFTPENWWLENDPFVVGMDYFQVLC